MSNYDETNRGVFFREKEKKNPKGPDYKGKLNVDGKEYEIAGWIKESKAGNKFMSLSVQEPRQKQEKPKQENRPAPSFADEPNDEIPFAWAFAIPIAGLITGAAYAQDVLQMWA